MKSLVIRATRIGTIRVSNNELKPSGFSEGLERIQEEFQNKWGSWAGTP